MRRAALTRAKSKEKKRAKRVKRAMDGGKRDRMVDWRRSAFMYVGSVQRNEKVNGVTGFGEGGWR
jgi:hypothetical protein